MIGFRLRNDHLEINLSEFIILKNKHENTTGRPLDNDLLYSYIKSRHPHQGQADMDIRALKGKKGRKGKGYKGGKGMYLRKGKGYKGKVQRKRQRKEQRIQRKRKGKGMKGKGKGQGCFQCDDPSHWSKECPKGKGRMSAVTAEEQGQG